VRFTKLAGLVIATVAVTACTSVAPVATPFISTPVTPAPGASALPTFAIPSAPIASVPVATITPASEASAVPSVPPTTAPSETPKPTRKPTPTPSPTPPPTPGDAEVHIDTSTIPATWYAGQPYTIRIYISALGTQTLPNVKVKVVALNENVSETFNTGEIQITDSYYHDVQLNLPAIGPTTISATASLPNGFVDTNKNNNKDSFDVEVQLGP
jgi:hypothetical protein